MLAQTEEIGASQSVNVGRELRLTNSYKGGLFYIEVKKGYFWGNVNVKVLYFLLSVGSGFLLQVSIQSRI